MQGVFFFVFSISVGLFENGRTGLELLRNKAFDDVGQDFWLVMVLNRPGFGGGQFV